MFKNKVRKSFQRVRQDVNALRYDSSNSIRYLNYVVGEQNIRIRELERRLAQLERLNIREKLVGE